MVLRCTRFANTDENNDDDDQNKRKQQTTNNRKRLLAVFEAGLREKKYSKIFSQYLVFYNLDNLLSVT